jgi:hypothetical protein
VSLRAAVAAAAWVVVSLVALLVLYQRVMFLNRVPTPKTPEALQDRAIEAMARLGYTEPPLDSASGLGYSLDYASYIDRTSTAPDRWSRLASQRPESFYLWHRTSPRPLVPIGFAENVSGVNPPMRVAGMTLALVDASGRLAEFLVVPDPVQPDAGAAPTNWSVLFDVAGLPMSAFTPVRPQWVPPVFADERMAWEGRLPELPDHTIRLEAAAHGGRPVWMALTGPWSRSAREPRGSPPLFNRILANLESVIMPGLMIAAAVLARLNVKAGRGDRRGAFRTATIVFVTTMTSWLLGGLIGVFSTDVNRAFSAIGRALFDAALLWVTYLGLEPYIRRYSPDSLIGWTRLIAGRWRDPHVARDVMIGVSAGLAMTVIYAVHNVIPPLLGRPEPMPITTDADLLMGTRYVLSYLLGRIGSAVQGAMLCVVGIVALLIWLKKPVYAAAAAVICFTPVAINGMFPPGTPVLDVALGTLLIVVFVGTSVRYGLLATMAALTTHFVLLRAPLTTEFGSWRGPTSYWFLGVVAVAGLGACYLARTGGAAAHPAIKQYHTQEI